MEKLDKFEQLVLDAKLPVCVLASPTLNDFELVNVDTLPLSPEALADFNKRNMHFFGVFGLVGGAFQSALTADLDDRTIRALAEAYVRHVFNALSAPRYAEPRGDSADWLRKLLALPDTRPEAN